MEQRLRDSSRNQSVGKASWRKDSRRLEQPRDWVLLSLLSQRITVYSDAQWPSGDACWLSFCEWSFTKQARLLACSFLGPQPSFVPGHPLHPPSFSQILELYSLGILEILGQINYIWNLLLFIIIIINFVCVSMFFCVRCLWRCVYCGIHVELRGRLMGVSSLSVIGCWDYSQVLRHT